jgi:hypothetical protein
VQIDVKFIAPIGAAPSDQGTATSPAGGRRKKYYQFAAIDDCTRLRLLRIYDRLNQKTAIAFRLRPGEASVPSKLTDIAVGRPGRNAADLVPERGCLPEGRAHARGHLPGSGGPDGHGPQARPEHERPACPRPARRGNCAHEKFSLDAIAREQAKRSAAASSGRSVETVYRGHEHALRQTVLPLTAGSSLDEHQSPSEAGSG